MLFTFKRDDEGRERIYCGEVHIADIKRNSNNTEYCHHTGHVPGVDFEQVSDAIERADEAGFWHFGDYGPGYNTDEVTVDVPIAETTVLSVTLEGEDQS